MDFELASNEKVVFVTEENDLYVDTKKVASDIKYYALYGSHLAFIDEDQLYVMENLGEKQAIEVQIDDYSSIYYLNKMVFRNQLSFEDIAGVWKFEEYGQKSFLDITKDGKYTFLNINDTEPLNLTMPV